MIKTRINALVFQLSRTIAQVIKDENRLQDLYVKFEIKVQSQN